MTIIKLGFRVNNDFVDGYEQVPAPQWSLSDASLPAEEVILSSPCPSRGQP
jgi:hypothetical protein